MRRCSYAGHTDVEPRRWDYTAFLLEFEVGRHPERDFALSGRS